MAICELSEPTTRSTSAYRINKAHGCMLREPDHKTTNKWVPGRAGNPCDEQADKMASEARLNHHSHIKARKRYGAAFRNAEKNTSWLPSRGAQVLINKVGAGQTMTDDIVALWLRSRQGNGAYRSQSLPQMKCYVRSREVTPNFHHLVWEWEGPRTFGDM